MTGAEAEEATVELDGARLAVHDTKYSDTDLSRAGGWPFCRVSSMVMEKQMAPGRKTRTALRPAGGLSNVSPSGRTR